MEQFNMERVYAQLSRYPGLPQAIGMDTATRFIRLAASLRRGILHAQRPGYNGEEAPERLPDAIHAFLGSALNLCDDFVQGCWDTFKETIWQYNPSLHSSTADAKLFYEHGTGHSLCKSLHFQFKIPLVMVKLQPLVHYIHP
jgi:hypothetical protein